MFDYFATVMYIGFAIVFIAGVAIGIGLYLLIPWLWQHIAWI